MYTRPRALSVQPWRPVCVQSAGVCVCLCMSQMHAIYWRKNPSKGNDFVHNCWMQAVARYTFILCFEFIMHTVSIVVCDLVLLRSAVVYTLIPNRSSQQIQTQSRILEPLTLGLARLYVGHMNSGLDHNNKRSVCPRSICLKREYGCTSECRAVTVFVFIVNPVFFCCQQSN